MVASWNAMSLESTAWLDPSLIAQVMSTTARYLEGRGLTEQAVALYHKAGESDRALELCFAGRLFDATALSLMNELRISFTWDLSRSPKTCPQIDLAYVSQLLSSSVLSLFLFSHSDPNLLIPLF